MDHTASLVSVQFLAGDGDKRPLALDHPPPQGADRRMIRRRESATGGPGQGYPAPDIGRRRHRVVATDIGVMGDGKHAGRIPDHR